MRQNPGPSVDMLVIISVSVLIATSKTDELSKLFELMVTKADVDVY